ncbi:MAG: SDR family oxidoreductase [Clostridiales bacterium]|nr:SDR family oxidoreductase [Clostridiales bacterium]
MNRVILATGAGRGPGYCIAKRHAELGDRVYACDVRVTDELRAPESAHASLRAFPCGIGSTQSINQAMGAVQSEPRLDILYNVAGIFRFEDRVSLAEADLDRCAPMYEINAVGALRVCAVNMSMKAPSSELYTRGVRVMLIHPGWMRTVMGGEGARREDT